ncbi:MAG: hypothetical protein H0T89_27755 [Deltaproteobacteria bacterium]|nr:hypothetical protein [Deltaproteobacteria bacterium]MDQ3296666.1 hypothetical protein [Myxococcota bacterium]
MARASTVQRNTLEMPASELDVLVEASNPLRERPTMQMEKHELGLLLRQNDGDDLRPTFAEGSSADLGSTTGVLASAPRKKLTTPRLVPRKPAAQQLATTLRLDIMEPESWPIGSGTTMDVPSARVGALVGYTLMVWLVAALMIFGR